MREPHPRHGPRYPALVARNSSQASSDDSVDATRVRLFHTAWLVFVGLHWLLSAPDWIQLGDGFLHSGSAWMRALTLCTGLLLGICVLHPDRRLPLLLLLLTTTAAKLDALPFVPNHIWCATAIQLAWITGLALAGPSTGARDGVVRGTLTAAPALRAILVLIYVFAAWHKLNGGYLDPSVSCGAEMYRDLRQSVPCLPDAAWVELASLAGTLAIEIALPLMLLVPSLRGFGVLLGVLFHLGLALHPNLMILSFSSEVFALYALFLPTSWVQRFGKAWIAAWSHPRFQLALRVLLGLAALTTFGFLAFALGDPAATWPRLRGLQTLGVWLGAVWALFVVGLAAMGVFVIGPAQGRSLPSPGPRWIAVLFPLLVAVSGLSPYLGLKTATDLSMFSNLVVDGERTNHLVMPSGFTPAPWQHDRVTLEESTLPYFRALIERGSKLTWFEFRRTLAAERHEGLTVVYTRAGERTRIRWPDDRAHEAFTPPSWWAQKLLIFREIPREGTAPCQW